MRNTLVYPFGKKFYPILKNAKNMHDIYIKYIVSPSGWGLYGNAYHSADHRILRVETNFEKCIEDSQLLWIVDSDEDLDFENIIVPLIDNAIFKGKKLLYTRTTTTEEAMFISTKYKESLISELCRQEESDILLSNDNYEEILTPVIAIGELYDGVDSFGAQLSLINEFADRGIKVLPYSYRNECCEVGIRPYPTFLYSHNIDFKQKVLGLHNYFKKIEIEEKPDLMLLSIPFGLLDFSPKCYSEFGYYGYLIPNAISIDIGMLNIPFLDCTDNELDKMSFEIFHRYGIPIEYFNMCPQFLLVDESKIYGKPQYLTLDSSFVQGKINSIRKHNVFVLESHEYVSKMTDHMISRLNYFGAVKMV